MPKKDQQGRIQGQKSLLHRKPKSESVTDGPTKQRTDIPIDEINYSWHINSLKTYPNPQKINTLSMIAPISNEEKQKLLETISLGEKTNTLLNIIEFYSYENSSDNETIQ